MTPRRAALLQEAYARLDAASPFLRHPHEYTHAEILGAVLLLLEEARQEVRAEHANVRALLREVGIAA